MSEFDDWPKDGPRFVCSPEQPMPAETPTGSQWAHSDIESVGEDYGGLSGGGDYDRMRCKSCGIKWWSELPD